MITLNGQPINVTTFPDKTSQVWKLPESTFTSKQKAQILWQYANEGEVIHFFQLLHLLDQKCVPSVITIPYLPYARQDKTVSNESSFALQTFWKLFNTFDYVNELIVHDPHNFNAVRPRCKVKCIYPTQQIQDAISECGSDLVCYPDKGAVSKYTEIYSYPWIYGEKLREQSTGNILSYQVVGECEGKNVLIIDDICDGGMTFKLLARDLLAAGAKSVVLFVTHGIFSKGVKTLLDSGITRVFTADGEVTTRN